MKLYIDFETYCDLDIQEVGADRYSNHKSAKVLCMAYKFGDKEVKLWHLEQEFPNEVYDHVKALKPVCAHNASFEYLIWNNVLTLQCKVPPLSYKTLSDTQIKCYIFKVRPRLAHAAIDLGLSNKLETGKALINKFCKPTRNGAQPKFNPKGADEQKFFIYCKQDVQVTYELDMALPWFKQPEVAKREQKIYEITWEMNNLGIPFDYENADLIYKKVQDYTKERLKGLSKLTHGTIKTINQHAKIKSFCEAYGVNIPNTQADTITKVLERDIPEPVRELLTLRADIGSTAIKKYAKGLALAEYSNVLDCYTIRFHSEYHGAGTGRYAGRGIQPQNFPRAKVEEPEKLIAQIQRNEFTGNMVTAAKQLLRPMICAPPGYKFFVADYSSIENRMLHYLADDQDTIKLFKRGLDQYKDLASVKYKVPYDEVTKEQRYVGKVIILGAGFQMGGKTFKKTAARFGLNLTVAEATADIKLYRTSYPKVTKMWNTLYDLVINVVMAPGKKFTWNRMAAQCTKDGSMLALQLINGKCMYYLKPKIGLKTIPGFESMGAKPYVSYMGVNPYSKKFERLTLTPGRVTENFVQATARECMVQGLINVAESKLPVAPCFTVHDEIVCIVRNEDATEKNYAEFVRLLCNIPFCRDFPISAEGYIAKRYTKD